MPAPISPGDRTAILEGAHRLLLGNLKKGHDGRFKREYSYVCPSLKSYPWQWFWDSCFHAIALSNLDVNLAKSELRNLMSVQAGDGFIPHVIHWGAGWAVAFWGYGQSKFSWRPKHTALVQPPVLAQAVRCVAERSQDEKFLLDCLDGVKRYYLWLRDNRDPDADGLISVITPYETGMDQLPAYDEAMGLKDPSRLGIHLRERVLDLQNLVMGRNYNLEVIFRRDRFNVEDVMMNCLYAQGLRDIAAMSGMVGDGVTRDSFTKLALRTEQAVLEKLYDPQRQAFWGLWSKHERPLKVMTVSSLFPVLLESIDRARLDELVQRHILNEEEFWLPYPVPSVAKSEPSFRASERILIWRGATWVNTNWFIMKGLQRKGYVEPARLIARKSAELVLKSGFREYYNPLTGEGYGAEGFGWSTLIADML